MQHLLRFAVAAVLLAANTTSSQAGPILITQSGFSGSETVITFNSIGNEVPINTQFVGNGVTFSGTVYGMTNPGDTSLFPSNGGGVIAANWRYSQGNGGKPFTDITATFSSLQTRVGFLAESNSGDSVLVDVYRQNSLLGSFILPSTGLTPQFIGIQDTSGIDRIVFNAQDNVNQFLAFDDFRFEAVGLVAPEPATLAVFGSLTVCAFGLRRRIVPTA